MNGPQGRIMMGIIGGTAECCYDIDDGGLIRFEAVIPGPWRVKGTIDRRGRCWARIERTGAGDKGEEPEAELEDEPGERLMSIMENLAARAAGKAGKN